MSPEELTLHLKEDFLTDISIAAGAEKTTSQKQELAIDSVFDNIIAYRALGQIIGKFLPTSNLEAKIADLEDKTSKHEELLKELQILIRNLGGSNLP